MGEIYVADTSNNLIRRIDTDGKVSVWAGQLGSGGHADGERLSARFFSPGDIAMGSDGTMYVADSGNDVIRAISPAGIVRTVAGQVSQSGNADGVGASAQFFALMSLLMEPSGSLLAVQRNGALRTVSLDGVVGTVKTSLPEGINVTGAGLDNAGHRLIAGRLGSNEGAALYRLDGKGNASLLAGSPMTSGANDSDSASALFGTITGVVEDANGNLLIADDYSELRAGGRFVMQTGGTTIRKLSTNGMVSTFAGRYRASGSTDGDRITGQLCGPASIKPYDGATWLVADKCNHAIRLLGAQGELKTLAGMAPASGNTDGTGDQARFNLPLGIATLQDGNAYVADFHNSSIRRINANGQTSQLTTIGASERGPMWLAGNGSDKFCFSDYQRVLTPSNTITIRCAGADGALRTLTTQWGAGGQQFRTIAGITSDRQGNWLITDAAVSFNALHSISSMGIVTSQLQNLNTVGAITSDRNGMVYLRVGNSIQKRMSDGSLSLVAGSVDSAGQQNGAGPQARFGTISALAMDTQDYLYVADGARIRLISPSGEVSTFAGTQSQYGVRLGDAPGSLASINGLALAADQKSLLATTANGVIRITLQR
jgi:hypothetical protein